MTEKFYFFSPWIGLLFVILLIFFILSSCFYLLRLLYIDHKDFRCKNINSETKKLNRNYRNNIKVAAKIRQKKTISSIEKSENKKIVKKRNAPNQQSSIEEPKKKKSRITCWLSKVFGGKKSCEKNKKPYNLFIGKSFHELNTCNYVDTVDANDVYKSQSYESFETMTTDSEYYRDWRHSIDFTNNILPLNQSNKILQQAYNQLYVHQQQAISNEQSPESSSQFNPVLNQIALTDLYPVSMVPFDFESTLQAYQIQNAQSTPNSQENNFYSNPNKNKDCLETIVLIKNNEKIKSKVEVVTIDPNLDKNMNLVMKN